MNSRRLLGSLLFFFACLLVSALVFSQVIPAAPSRIEKEEVQPARVLHYLAIGDSLTEGVGDVSGQGGFVPLLAQELRNQYGGVVQSYNAGVSGNTSSQILSRLEEDATLQDQLIEADVLTLTVGGNDFRKALLSTLGHLTAERFEQPAASYAKRLDKLLQFIREKNPTVPIYVLGIYNPFYLNFPDLADIHGVVDMWNQITETTVTAYPGVYFVPINDRLSKGLDQAISKPGGPLNALLSEEDSFHPNLTGYEIMKQAVMESIRETKQDWPNQ